MSRLTGARFEWEEEDIAFVSIQILDALNFLHSNRVWHGKIRSNSIYVNRNGNIKVGDFSDAASFGEYCPSRSSANGTPYWTAPEMLLGEPDRYSGKSDIWSFGIVLFEIIEHAPPYLRQRYPSIKVMYRIATRPPPSLAQPNDLSPKLVDFVDKCLIKNLAKRPNASELLEHSFLFRAGTSASFFHNIYRLLDG